MNEKQTRERILGRVEILHWLADEFDQSPLLAELAELLRNLAAFEEEEVETGIEVEVK